MADALVGPIALIIFALSFGLWIRALKRVEIPENGSAFIAAWVVAFALGVISLNGEQGWMASIPGLLAIFGSAFVLFTISISRQKVGTDAIQVGATIPAFTATDELGQVFDSRSLAGHPVLIKFFRAHW